MLRLSGWEMKVPDSLEERRGSSLAGGWGEKMFRITDPNEASPSSPTDVETLEKSNRVEVDRKSAGQPK